jgi:hypothetical protein
LASIVGPSSDSPRAKQARTAIQNNRERMISSQQKVGGGSSRAICGSRGNLSHISDKMSRLESCYKTLGAVPPKYSILGSTANCVVFRAKLVALG